MPILLILFLLCSCTEKELPNPEFVKLEKSIIQLKEKVAGYEEKIKAAVAGTDSGLALKYQHDRDLDQSRLERMIVDIKKIKPDYSASTPAVSEAGGAHH